MLACAQAPTAWTLRVRSQSTRPWAALDQRAKASEIMLLPGVGFDVAPTDCLAAHLKRGLPSATHLALAIMSEGPATLVPGTLNTAVEMIPYRHNVRRHGGRLEPIPRKERVRLTDFGHGPVEATMLGWGDVFIAFYSTGIPNAPGAIFV